MTYIRKENFFEMDISCNELQTYSYKTKRLSSKAMILKTSLWNGGTVKIQYVNTIVFEYENILNNEKVILRTGGRKSNTTKKWIQYGLDIARPGKFDLYQKNFVWYISDKVKGEVIEFKGNILIINL